MLEMLENQNWDFPQPKSVFRNSLRLGWTTGIFLGGVEIAYYFIKNFGDLDAFGYGTLNHTVKVIIFLSFLWAGWNSCRHTGEIKEGIKGALGAGFISILLTILAFWIMVLFFKDNILENRHFFEEFLKSGEKSLDYFLIKVYVIRTIAGPIITFATAFVLGGIGAYIGKISFNKKREANGL